MRLAVNRPKVINQTIDGEALLINFETGNYYSLLKSGAFIWSLIERTATVGEIVAALENQYQGGRRDVFQDAAVRFVSELQAEGLIISSEDGVRALPDPLRTTVEFPAQHEQFVFEPPVLEKYEDMQDLILLDPVHEVDEEAGWPHLKPKPDG